VLLERYGAQVTHVRAPVGGRPSLAEVEAALETGSFKVMTITHVDTSTGVLADVRGLAALAMRHGVLSVVDGVCSVAGEELRMTDWDVDVALTASQKAIGVPPGLALLVAGPQAMEVFRQRKTPVANYYADWTNWLPIMDAYETRKGGYFGTPPVNLIWALNVSLGQILAEGMDARFERHRVLGRACKQAVAALGLAQVPLQPEYAANTMTAPFYPDDVQGAELLARIKEAGAVLAGGLHPAIRTKYFRIGHMGATNRGDLLATIGALEAGLSRCAYPFRPGAALSAAAAVFAES